MFDCPRAFFLFFKDSFFVDEKIDCYKRTSDKKGYEIKGLDEAKTHSDIVVFHAGTAIKDGKYVTNGGRVLGITGIGKDLDEAIKIAYGGVDIVTFENVHYRHDIGIKKY